MAHFLLTNKLLPLLNQNRPSRVVVTSSGAYRGGNVDWTDLQAERSYNGWNQYSVSKMLNHLFTFALARRFANDTSIPSGSMTANAFEPGGVQTKLFEAAGGRNGASVQIGAASLVYLAQSPDVEGVNGQYFNREKQQIAANDFSRDQNNQEKLWQISVDLCKNNGVW